MSIASKTVVLAAISSRTYAEAAVNAGFDVIAIDAFSDVDLQKVVKQCYQVNVMDYQLDGMEVLETILKLEEQPVLGFSYGAGFEENPQIFQQISQHMPILGNTADAVSLCKQPANFFGICNQLEIRYPAVCYQRPTDDSEWLQKRIGGSGGNHVVALENAQDIDSGSVYYQRLQSGSTISCLFVVNHGNVEVIGFNLQWVEESSSSPYRYSGAMSNADISKQAKLNFTNYIKQLATALGLQGLNSCDAICDGDDIYILEINPRLSASIDLYPDKKVMQKHIAAFLQPQQDALLSEQLNNDSVPTRTHVAHQVIYARHPVVVKNDITWPSWVRDVPHSGQQFDSGMPVCSVKVEADTADQVRMGLIERVAWVERQILN